MFEDWYITERMTCFEHPELYPKRELLSKIDYLLDKTTMLVMGQMFAFEADPDKRRQIFEKPDGYTRECYLYWRGKIPDTDLRALVPVLNGKAAKYGGWYKIPEELLTREEVVFLITYPFTDRVRMHFNEYFIIDGSLYKYLTLLKKLDSRCDRLYKMSISGTFDSSVAETLIQGIDLNKLYMPVGEEYPVTFLSAAVEHNNLEAVRFFLSHGADPNYCDSEGEVTALWDLQYTDGVEDTSIRYEIRKLFFEYGANANHCVPGDDEDLYSYIVFKVYNELDDEIDFEYLLQFYKLLVVYGGGGTEYCHYKPDISKVDMSKIDEYRVKLVLEEKNINGYLVDKEDNIIVEL